MQAAGARIVFRSTELGEVKRDPDGAPTFHVHAHTIIDLERKLSRSDWSGLLKRVRAWWKHHFADSQRIHQAREACKYVVKPGDLEQLNSGELVALHEQLFRLHLVQCLGELKALRAKLKESRTRLVRRKEGVETRWEEVADWNRYKIRKDDYAEETETVASGPPEDWLVCTLPPSFALSGRAEPLAVVLNHTGTRICDNSRLKMIREACASAYAGDRQLE